MPKLDDCHYQIARALQTDGWQIMQNGLYVDDEFTNALYIDIQAMRPGNGTLARSIFVEAKCFPSPRKTPDLHRATGQYLVYRVILDDEGFSDPLYMAVPADTFEEYFNERLLKAAKKHSIKLVVVDIEQESVVQWIK